MRQLDPAPLGHIPFMTPLLCSEFKIIVQQILDGRQISDTDRGRVRDHRTTCDSCCGFHDGLLGVTAIAPEMELPDEYKNAQSSKLWNRIVAAADENSDLPPKVPSAFPVSKLDASKIHPPATEGGPNYDIARFLFGPEELESFGRITNPSNQNPQIERVGTSTLELLAKLQDLVFDLPTVMGTMVLSPDGSILDSRLARDMRNEQLRDDIGTWSLAAYHNAQAAAGAFGFNRVTQIVSRTETGYVIIANLNDLTLIVLIDGSEDNAWNAVARLSAVTK